MLKLKLEYFGHLMRRVNSLEKTLMLGGIGDRRRRGRQRMGWLDGITDLMDVSLSELREMVMNRVAWCAAIHGVTKSRTRLSDWTELNWTYKGNAIHLTADLSAETLQARREWHDIFKVLKGKKSTTKIIVPGKDLIQNWWRNKKFFRQAKEENSVPPNQLYNKY